MNQEEVTSGLSRVDNGDLLLPRLFDAGLGFAGDVHILRNKVGGTVEMSLDYCPACDIDQYRYGHTHDQWCRKGGGA